MIAAKDDIKIRKLTDTDEDYALMLKWLTNSDLLEYYEGRDQIFDLAKIKAKYRPRILGKENVVPCIFEANSESMGYLQYYELDLAVKKTFGLREEPKAAGVDLFIGEVVNMGKGIGTKVLQLLTAYLLQQGKFDLVTIDPRVNNPRAIRSYEKAGFSKVKLLPKHELHEEVYYDCWLMVNR